MRVECFASPPPCLAAIETEEVLAQAEKLISNLT
jgi:hypothetical protein